MEEASSYKEFIRKDRMTKKDKSRENKCGLHHQGHLPRENILSHYMNIRHDISDLETHHISKAALCS